MLGRRENRKKIFENINISYIYVTMCIVFATKVAQSK